MWECDLWIIQGYCDRVLIGGSTFDNNLFTPYNYGALTNYYIDFTDHDLVYGTFTYAKMNILSITLNMEGLTKIKSLRKPCPRYQDKRVWDMILCDIKW